MTIKKILLLTSLFLLLGAKEQDPEEKSIFQGIINYLLNYRLGTDLTSESNATDVTYRYNSPVPLDPSRCEDKGDGDYICNAHVEISPHVSTGIFIEQPFERTGFWHFDFAAAFAIRQAQIERTTFTTAEDLAPSGYASPPLQRFGYSLIGINTIAYIEFGIAPEKFWPDLLFDFGLGLQSLVGKTYLDDQTFQRPLINFLAYGEINLVMARWGNAGYVGFYAAAESGSVSEGSLEVNGMSQFTMNFVRKDIGLRIVTNIPEKFF